MSFWRISIILTIIGSAYSAFQYYNNVEKAKADVAELKVAIAQAEENNKQHQLSWERLGVVQGKATQVRSTYAGLQKQKEELQSKIKGLEGEFQLLVKTTQAAVDKARTDAAAQSYPEIKLEDGRVLRDAKIRKFEGSQISFIHADGIGPVSSDLLPEQLRQKLALGSNDLAVEAATLEKNLFSSGGEQNFEGLKLRCTYPLLDTGKSFGIQQGGPIKSSREFSHKAPDIEINVASVQYADGSALDIDQAMDGAVKGILKLEGISNPSHQIQSVTITGATAKRLSFTARRFGETLNLEAVYVIRGQHMWFVQTIFTEKTKESRPSANSILSSIEVKS